MHSPQGEALKYKSLGQRPRYAPPQTPQAEGLTYSEGVSKLLQGLMDINILLVSFNRYFTLFVVFPSILALGVYLTVKLQFVQLFHLKKFPNSTSAATPFAPRWTPNDRNVFNPMFVYICEACRDWALGPFPPAHKIRKMEVCSPWLRRPFRR